MESEFLLVWVSTAGLHLAVPGVTLLLLEARCRGRAWAGNRHVLQWPHRTKYSRRALGWGAALTLHSRLCGLGRVPTLQSLPCKAKKQSSLCLPWFRGICLVASKGNYIGWPEQWRGSLVSNWIVSWGPAQGYGWASGAPGTQGW